MMRLLALILGAVVLHGAVGNHVEVVYPSSAELPIGVTHKLWVPARAKKIRAVIVHQHGCGAPAAQGGATAAADLHWQALAAKWDAALLGPSYHQAEGQDCRLWSDPRKGSGKAFLHALDELGAKAGHPEIGKAPWVLWGHSGGGFWVGVMSMLHPERVVAVWLRSGAPAAEPEIPEAVYSIPMMANAGVKEQHDRFRGAWENALKWHRRMRAKGAPSGFAPDPRTSHETGDSRYLAIPWFDACLAMRLPSGKAGALRPVGSAGVRRGPDNNEQSSWLPNETVARAWMEYGKTGAVSDSTPPAAPSSVTAKRNGDAVEITWDAEADLESGVRAFIVERDAVAIAQMPAEPVGKFGRPLFQSMSYHDTPTPPLPAMQYIDRGAPAGKHRYRIVTINSVGLKSRPSRPAEVR